jgi:hypothetical protein
MGVEANAAPALRRACRRLSFPEPVTLNRLLAPEWVLFFGIVLSSFVVRRVVAAGAFCVVLVGLRGSTQWW